MAFIGNTNTTQAFTPAIDYFSGTGSATAFTLSRPVASVAQVQVTIDNVAQNPSAAYTVSSNTITFTSAPLSGTNNIYVYYTSPITQVIAPGQGTVTTTSMASSTGTGAGVFQTSPTITTPVISSLSSASATALTLQSAGTTAITVDTSQNVGIGTTTIATIDSTGKTLEIYGGAGGGFVHMTNSTTGQTVSDGFIIGTSIGGSDALLIQRESANMIFRTADTERMRIDSSGNLLVAKTAISNTTVGVEVRPIGNVWSTMSDSTNSNTTWNTYSTSAGAYRFYVGMAGTVYATSTTITAISDQRLKENIRDLDEGLATVMALKPRKFDWKSGKGADIKNARGFIAQEFETVLPDMIDTWRDPAPEGEEPYKAINANLIPTLVKAIQELKAINDTQAETINALTARIEALENR